MSLLKPTAGEIIDRLSILALKIEEAAARKIDYSAFVEERDALRAEHELPELTTLSLELAAINGRLWETTAHPGYYDFFFVHRLNRRRAELVKRLTELIDEQPYLEKL